MRQIPVQQDDITSLPAEDFNDIPREEENLITSGGISLSELDLFQMAKSVANYSATGASYVDTGAANLYSLSTLSAQEGLTRYLIGTAVRFKVSNTNTNTACTVTVNGVGAIPIHVGYLPNGGTPSVPVGFIVEDETVEIVYDLTPDSVTPYFRVRTFSDAQITDVSLTKLTNGQASVESGDLHMDLSAIELFFELDDGTQQEFLQLNKDEIQLANNASSTNSYQSTITETTRKRNNIQMVSSGRGHKYSVGPGDAGYKGVVVRKSEFAATVSWDFVSGSDPFLGFKTATNVTLTGIPAGTTIHRVSIRYVVSTDAVTVQVYAKTDDSGVDEVIQQIVAYTGGETPDNSITVLVEYNGSGL